MRLSFFPEILPGELLYSALARFGVLRGLTSPKAVMTELFGRSSTIATMDLPNNLKPLFGRLPALDGFNTDAIIDRHTLFRYYTAFQPPERRTAARKAMMGMSGSLHLLLGVATFRTGRPTHLQFCPGCADDAEERHGFLHWRADHQLPGVLVCSTHGRRLRRSSVHIGSVNRHAYIPASRENCPMDCDHVTQTLRGRSLDQAIDLARAASWLLDDETPALSMEHRRDDYRMRLSRAGLVRGRFKVDQTGLQSSFRDHFGELLHRLDGVQLEPGSETWLNSIVRTSSGAHPPLQHILLRMFLDAGYTRSPAKERWATPVVTSSPAGNPAASARVMDWKRIDREYAAAIRSIARELRQLTPPRRVTAAAIERGLTRRGWLAKRRDKLPAATSAMGEVAEGTEAFRLRRLRWHARKCLADGICDPWIVLRRAGLPHGHVDLVRNEMASLEGTPESLSVAA